MLHRNIAPLLCAFLTLVMLSSCASAPPPKVVFTQLPPVSTTKSSILDVHFFIDGTESMEGFAQRTAQRTAYQVLLQSLEDSLPTLSPTPTLAKYRFGSKIAPVQGSLKLTAGEDKNFYDAGIVGNQTQIQTVLLDSKNTCSKFYASNKKDTLNVIITDLFQTDSEIGRVVNALQQCFLLKDRVVGLIGVRSDYDGTVYDFTPNGSSMRVKGLRPVYAIITGTYANVSAYFEGLKVTSPELKQRKALFSIFSTRIFEEPVNFWRTEPLTTAEGVLFKRGLIEGSPIYGFEFPNPTQAEIFTACTTTPKPLSADMASYKPSPSSQTTTVIYYPLDAKDNTPGQTLTGRNIIQVKTSSSGCPNDAPVGYEVTLDPQRLQQQGTTAGHYLVRIAFQPSLQDYPKDWERLNTSDAARQPLQTLNLSRFIKSLYGATLAVNSPQDAQAIHEAEMIFFITR